jgi:hypothetical protein
MEQKIDDGNSIGAFLWGRLIYGLRLSSTEAITSVVGPVPGGMPVDNPGIGVGIAAVSASSCSCGANGISSISESSDDTIAGAAVWTVGSWYSETILA